MSLCQIQPISAFMSTNLNSQIECYQRLGQRILRTLGHPMINIEVHPDQLYEAISMSIDFFTKYGGYTKETLIFDSRLYEKDRGLRLDHLFTVANTDYTPSQILQNRKIGPDPDFIVDIPKTLYISQSAIPQSYFTTASSLSSDVPEEGITKMQIINEETYQSLTAFDSNLAGLFIPSKQHNFTVQCEPQNNVKSFNNMFDYDVLDYRKVMDVIRFEEGSSTGVNNLFSMESFMQQQSYYSMALGNFGFDMLSWHTTKDWIDTREKLFSTRRDMHFDQRTQYLKLTPQPRNSRFYGIIECYVERPIRDLVKEKWVLEYATAITKIMWGRILTKINGVNLLGGGTINGSDVLQEGNADKERLETMLIEGGYGDYDGVTFMIM
jgi:hypothetical protein